MKLRPIEKDFTFKGFRFVQIERRGEWAIYHQTKGKSSAYEVVRIRRKNPHPLSKDGFDKIEAYPRPRKWGKFGFTEQSIEAARARLNALVPPEASKTATKHSPSKSATAKKDVSRKDKRKR